MRFFTHRSLCLGLAVALLFSGGAWAGAITVSPTRISLSIQRPIATLEVRNEGEEPVTVQLERLAWTQADGQDVYSPSAALIATPSVFELAPHAKQVLRVAMRDASAASAERAFRIYATEVPVKQTLSSSGLQMSLRIGVPVFVETTDQVTPLQGSIVSRSEGQIEVRLRNGGDHFARAVHLELKNPAGAVLWQSQDAAYLLAGSEHRWMVDSQSMRSTDVDRLKLADRLRLTVSTETGVNEIDVRPLP